MTLLWEGLSCKLEVGVSWLAQGLAVNPEVTRDLLVKGAEVWVQRAAEKGPGEAAGMCGHQGGRGPHADPGPKLLALRAGALTVLGSGSLDLFIVKFSEFMLFLQLISLRNHHYSISFGFLRSLLKPFCWLLFFTLW